MADTNTQAAPKKGIPIRDFLWHLRLIKGTREGVMRPLLESAGMADVLDADMPPEAAPPPGDAPVADHESALRDAFLMAGENTFMAVLSGQLDPNEGARKLKELLMAHAKLCGGGDSPPPQSDGPVGVKEARGDTAEERERKAAQGGRMRMPVQATESDPRDARILELEARETCRALCEAADLKPGEVLLKALVGLPDEAARKALLEEVRPKAQPQRPHDRATGGTRQQESGPETDSTKLAALLTGRTNGRA